MHQKLNSTQKAELLTSQLNSDIAALDGNVVAEKTNVVTTTVTFPTEGRAVLSVNSLPVSVWEEPMSLEPIASKPPFPIHCLPEALRDYALAVSEDTQTSIDMSAVAAIGTASACLQGKYLVQGKSGLSCL